MKIQWNGNEEIIYSLRERVDTDNSNEVKDELLSILNKYNPRILTIDMKNVRIITSAGLGALLKIKKIAVKKDIRMRFKNMPEIVLNIIDITGFDIIFELYNPKKND